MNHHLCRDQRLLDPGLACVDCNYARFSAGCAPPVIPSRPGTGNTTDSTEPLDGRGLFEYRVKSELAGSRSLPRSGRERL